MCTVSSDIAVSLVFDGDHTSRGRGFFALISANFFSTWLENTKSALRCLSSGMSLAMAPSVLMPVMASIATFSGFFTEWATAVPSKPQCTMQSAHFS